MDNQDVQAVAVVLNYNDVDTCINFFKETLDYKVIDRFIVVDNKSTDNSVEILRSFVNDKIELICSDCNKGFAYGNNLGIRYALNKYNNLKYIIVTNPDIHVKENDIVKIIKPLDDGFGMSTGLIYNYTPINHGKSLASNFGWKIPTYFDMLCNCFLLAYKLKRSVFHASMYLEWNKVNKETLISAEAVPGCFFILSSEAAQRIDCLDERTFLFGEETLLGWRLKKNGYKTVIVNGTEILHEQSTSINKSIKARKKKNEMLLQSELIYVKHYLKCGALKTSLFTFMFRIGLIEKFFIGKIISSIRG